MKRLIKCKKKFKILKIKFNSRKKKLLILSNNYNNINPLKISLKKYKLKIILIK